MSTFLFSETITNLKLVGKLQNLKGNVGEEGVFKIFRIKKNITKNSVFKKLSRLQFIYFPSFSVKLILNIYLTKGKLHITYITSLCNKKYY